MQLVIAIYDYNVESVEFIIHYTNSMPVGSPNFLTEDSIIESFERIDKLFCFARSIGYEGDEFNTWEKKVLEG